MLTWQELRTLTDDKLSKQDFASVNLACAAGLSGADEATLAERLARLDELTERARAAQQPVPSNGRPAAYYRVQQFVTSLRDAVCPNATVHFPVDDQGEDLLLADLLRGKSRSRSAFLVLCVAIGRRLGYPLKLLATKAEKFFYLFARWDEGEHFNIDVSPEGLCSHSDDYYRTDQHEVSPRQEKRSRMLRVLTPQEELALFLGARGMKWEAAGNFRQAIDAFAWSSTIAHWNDSIRHILALAIQRWRAALAPLVPPAFPTIDISRQGRRYPYTLYFEQEQAIVYTETVEMLLRDPAHNQQWWEPMRQGIPLRNHPVHIAVRYTPAGCDVKMTLAPHPHAEQLPIPTALDAFLAPPGTSFVGGPLLPSPASFLTAPQKSGLPAPAAVAVAEAPAEESGPLTIERLLRMPEDRLAKVDIAEKELVLAAGLPGTKDLDIPGCLKTLDEWKELIQDVTPKTAWRFEREPEKYDHSWATFRVVTMVLILQRNLGLKYNEERRQNLEGDDFFNRAEDIFIHGIISGNGGTCSSIPVLCVAVGRRLGYPLKLVHTARHVFFRWDEPGGAKINFEASSNRGLNAYPDDHYRSWPMQVTPEIEDAFCLLQSLTPRGELANFLAKRGACWWGNGNYQKALKCYGWASALDPENLGPVCNLRRHLEQWKEKLKPRLAKDLPSITVSLPKRCWFSVAWELETGVVKTAVVEDLLRDYKFAKIVDRAKKGKRLAGAPKTIKVDYPDRLMFDI